MKRKKGFLICYFILFVISFVFVLIPLFLTGIRMAACEGGDDIVKLYDGYRYNITGSSIYKADGKQIHDVQIPSGIDNCCQTEYYILARQDSVNYWILNKETNSIEGPLCKTDFDRKCELYDAEYIEGPNGVSSTYPFLIHRNHMILWPTALFLFVVFYLCSDKMETFVRRYKYEVVTALGIATNVALCVIFSDDTNTGNLIFALWLMIVMELSAIQLLKGQRYNTAAIIGVALAYLVADFALLILSFFIGMLLLHI